MSDTIADAKFLLSRYLDAYENRPTLNLWDAIENLRDEIEALENLA
jgi:hypothetical protein